MAKAERTCACKPVKFKWSRFVGAIIAIIIIAQIIHTVGAMATMGYYMDPAYLNVWSSIMMPNAGPPGAEFYSYSIGFGIISAIFFILVYSMMGCCVPGKTLANRGLLYGLLIFLVGGLPGMLSMVLLINLPVDLVAFWAVEGLVINLISGLVVAYLIK